MSNYEKVMQLLNEGIAKKHYDRHIKKWEDE